jgi:hypothetical protein
MRVLCVYCRPRERVDFMSIVGLDPLDFRTVSHLAIAT